MPLPTRLVLREDSLSVWEHYYWWEQFYNFGFDEAAPMVMGGLAPAKLGDLGAYAGPFLWAWRPQKTFHWSGGRGRWGGERQVSDPVGLEGLNLAFQDFPNLLSLCIQSSVLGFLSWKKLLADWDHRERSFWSVFGLGICLVRRLLADEWDCVSMARPELWHERGFSDWLLDMGDKSIRTK